MASIIAASSRNAFKRAAARPSTSSLSAMPRFYSSTVHDNDPEVLEQEKRRNLNKEQHKTSTPLPDHAPGWNENLASASEAAVKADRWSGATPKDLQEKTVKYVNDRHHANDTAGGLSEPPPHEPGVSTSHMKHNGPATVEEKVEHKEDVVTRKKLL